MVDGKMSIREVSEAVGLSQHLLRQWEDRFPMLRPPRDRQGRRQYREEDVKLIRRIKELHHHEGLSTEGVIKRLRLEKMGGKPVVGRQEIVASIDEMIGQIDGLIEKLEQPISDDE